MKHTEQAYAKASFHKVAEHYDQIDFFKRSAEIVACLIEERLTNQNATLLDVACGTGNVVLECAKRLKDSTFDAIDISEDMLEQAKQNAKENNISNVRFLVEDISQFKTQQQYHVITCSYALFFLPEPAAILKKLHQSLTDDGLIIFTSFQTTAFTPVKQIILSLLREYGSASALEYNENRWENLQSKTDILRLCKQAGIGNIEIIKQPIQYPLSVEKWWILLNNTGYKGMLMELTETAYEEVKHQFFRQMQQHQTPDQKVTLTADSYFTCVSKARN